MEFCNYEPVYKSYTTMDYAREIAQIRKSSNPEEVKSHQECFATTECRWIMSGRPYYNVWPKIIPSLCKMNLDSVPTSFLSVPGSRILMRFDKSTALPFDDGEHRAYWAMVAEAGDKSLATQLVAFMNVSMNDRLTERWMSASVLPLHRGMSIEQEISLIDRVDGDLPAEFGQSCSWLNQMLHLICAVLIIAKNNDPELIQPDVLSKDRAKWEETKDHAIVERAIRRGKHGWDVGREIHVSPHWRRPHPALYHVGKGRTEHRIVFRKGALVKRDDVAKLPTGYLSDKEVE